MLRAHTMLSVGCLALSSAVAFAAPKEFSDEEVTAAVEAVIAERSKDGVFPFVDARTGEELSLVLDDVRVVRGLPRFGWFPNVNFHVVSEPKKKYALDFWLKPDGERLELMAIRVHKAPQAEGASWMSITRAPLAWWWLPTMKRQSAVSGMPAWQVMGAIHSQVLATARDGVVAFPQADGSELTLRFVDVEQPVGKTKGDDRYFACAVLRMFGSEPVFYSTAYWLDGKTKRVTAGNVKRLEWPPTGGSKAAAEPHCDVEGATFEIVD